MKTQSRILAVAGVTVLAGAMIAGAQVQHRAGPGNRPDRSPEGFKCPVCGSPCISRAAVQQYRTQRMQPDRGRPFGPQPPVNARQGQRHQPRSRQPAAAPNRKQHKQQQQMRFDLDGDGRLSAAERAARKAYAQALQEENGRAPAERKKPRPPKD